jgi:hypothetical protein
MRFNFNTQEKNVTYQLGYNLGIQHFPSSNVGTGLGSDWVLKMLVLVEVLPGTSLV